MELIKVSAKEYKSYFNKTFQVFNTVEFSELNKSKVDEVVYFLFKDAKVRLGIVLGKKGNELNSPFSAPFGGFSFIKDDVSLSSIENSLRLLEEYASLNNNSIKISIPPDFYSTCFINKVINSFLRSCFNLYYTDINYSFSLENISDYKSKIWRNARKNLNHAENYSLDFRKAENLSEIKLAYSVIKENRESKGYPLRMSFDSVLETLNVINADFFNLFYNEISIAAAQIFHVTDEVVQVIYWGDKPGFENMRPMNFLAFKVFEYYEQFGIKHIDIGPSSENGIPNYGLCDFKEGIGCSITNKFTFKYESQSDKDSTI